MSENKVDAGLLSKMFLAGAKNLEVKKEWINELNVFPVPDGDTGTNMTMTILSAVAEVNRLQESTMMDLSKAISSGSLRGARGNSGVILSQLLRGFTKGIREYETLDVQILASASVRAVETAYKAVMKPKEGTILTVARGISDKAVQLAADPAMDMDTFLSEIIKEADAVLQRTPDMLPVLKEAGVVDSGGQGLVTILEGAYDAFAGKEIDLTFQTSKAGKPEADRGKPEGEIRFGYCTEFIINTERSFSSQDETVFKQYLNAIGDSIVLVADEHMVKVHVHTNTPGEAITKALGYGSLSAIKIDNMREEHQARMAGRSEKEAEKPQPKKETGFISVSVGEGFAEVFQGLGADYLIEGGQTMNPSTEDILEAIRRVNAATVFLLPNNKNIILAANQARELTKDKNVIVIPTKSVPQGISALITYVADRTPEENEQAMKEAIGLVKTLQVTYAVRDTKIDDKQIKKDDIMGLGDNGILSVGSDVASVALAGVASMVEPDSELISIYYGSDYKQEEAEKLEALLAEKYEDCDVEVNYGGQPIYYCIISVE